MIPSVVPTVGAVLILVAVGYILYRVKWIQNDHIKLLTRIVVYIGAPCLAVNNLYAYVTPELLANSGLAFLAAACGVLLGAFVGWLGGRFARVAETRRGLVISMSAHSNAMFVGLPMVSGILGDIAIPYVMYYFIIIRLFVWSLGLYFIKRDAAGGKARLLSIETVKGLVNAPNISFIASLILVAAHVSLPEVVLKASGYLGDLVTPLSLILIGAVMGRCGIKKSLKFERGMETILLSRFVFVPLITFALMRLFGFEPIGVQAYTLLAAMPVMTQAVVQCEQYGADADFAAKNIVVTTIVCAVTVPLTCMLIL